MTLHKHVKYNAKRCLCNNWGKAVAIVLLSTAIYLLFVIIEMLAHLLLKLPAGPSAFILGQIPDSWILSGILSLVMALGSYLLLVPLHLGTTFWYYSLSEGTSEDILGIFCAFANRHLFFRSLGLAFCMGVRSLLYALLYLLLPGAGTVASLWLLNHPVFEGAVFVGSMSLVLSLVLLTVAAVFWGIHIQKYFLAEYYLLDGKTSVHKALKSSIHATHGRRDEIFLFKLSFIGWGIASLFVLPTLYSSPYFSMSSLLYARVIMEEDRRRNSIVPFVPMSCAEEQQDTKTFETPGSETLEEEN